MFVLAVHAYDTLDLGGRCGPNHYMGDNNKANEQQKQISHIALSTLYQSSLGQKYKDEVNPFLR